MPSTLPCPSGPSGDSRKRPSALLWQLGPSKETDRHPDTSQTPSRQTGFLNPTDRSQRQAFKPNPQTIQMHRCTNRCTDTPTDAQMHQQTTPRPLPDDSQTSPRRLPRRLPDVSQTSGIRLGDVCRVYSTVYCTTIRWLGANNPSGP